MDQYHVLELIGEGSFGRVYKGRAEVQQTGELLHAAVIKQALQLSLAGSACPLPSCTDVALKFIPKLNRSPEELRHCNGRWTS